MSKTRIRPDKDQHIREFKIRIGKGRRVEAEGLFVGDMRCGHALAGVTVTVHESHAELEQTSEEGHLLSSDLSCAQESNRLRTIVAPKLFESLAEQDQGALPIARLQGDRRGPPGPAGWCRDRERTVG